MKVDNEYCYDHNQGKEDLFLRPQNVPLHAVIINLLPLLSTRINCYSASVPIVLPFQKGHIN